MSTRSHPLANMRPADLDAVSVEALAQRAIANGWPREEVVALADEIVGPLPAEAAPFAQNDDVGGASAALHRLFAEAANRSTGR